MKNSYFNVKSSKVKYAAINLKIFPNVMFVIPVHQDSKSETNIYFKLLFCKVFNILPQ